MSRIDAGLRRDSFVRLLRRAALAALALALAIGGWATAATYEYDPFGRLVEVVHDDGSIVGYSYDAAGNRTEVALSIDPTYFSVNDVSVTEGGNLVFTVTRSGLTDPPHSVDYSTANGTATAGSDYTATSGTLSFASSETSKTVTVTTLQDSIFEAGETVLLNLSSATGGATISDIQGVGTINNDDAGPAFSVNDVSATEGGDLVFTVTKTGATTQSHAVSYGTANGTAASGSDYTAASSSLTFASGETTKTVTVSTTNDSVFEASETLYLNLSSATNGASISDSQGVGTINDNDVAPAFSVNDVSANEGSALVFTVTKTGSTALSHAVNYATANGTALSGSDYTAVSSSLTFAAGETTKTVSVATIDDSGYEPNETLYLNLSSATNGATISDSQGVGTINMNDGSPPVATLDAIVDCGSYGPDSNYYYYYNHCAAMSATDPDGGTAYFINSSYPNWYSHFVGTITVNPWPPGYYYFDCITSANIYVYDTTGGSRNYTLSGSWCSSYTLTPIVIDLDGDGLELVSARATSIKFDVDGDGGLELTGWAGADDGLLVLDRDGDGRITTGAEISFVEDFPGARTDMEGLRAYDTNGDGVFDAEDERFAEFRIWRDADQDGVSAPDELRPLADWGIRAIDLAVIPTGQSAAGALDNVITGRGRVLRLDGSEGELGDATFAYAKLELIQQETSGETAGPHRVAASTRDGDAGRPLMEPAR